MATTIPKTEKKSAAAPAKKEKKDSIWKFIISMIIEQKLTDEKIVEKAVTVFPEKKSYLSNTNVSFCRSKLNAGKMGIDGKMYSGKKLVRIMPPEAAKKSAPAKTAKTPKVAGPFDAKTSS